MAAFPDDSKRASRRVGICRVLGGLGCILLSVQLALAQKGVGDIVYVPTPEAVVDRLLEMAQVKAGDFIIDLGSGDGRIVITAAKKYGARGLGVDLDPYLVQLSKDNAWREGVRARADFIQRNIFDTDVTQASVVASYLSPELNVRLRPKLFAQLKPGARIISHDYGMGDWQPDEAETMAVPGKTVGAIGESAVFLWIVPANVIGTWEIKLPAGTLPVIYEAELEQTFQVMRGYLKSGKQFREMKETKLHGDHIEFTVDIESAGEISTHEFSGRVEGKNMRGEDQVTRGGQVEKQRWEARRITPPRPLDKPPGG